MMALTKAQAVILGILGLFGQRVHRTKLVKLVYLADNTFHEHTGNTLTGLVYMWDNYGPNAVSNVIVKEMDGLVSSGKAFMHVQTSVYGTDSYLYWSSEPAAREALEQLSPGEIQVLRDTVKRFGHFSVKGIVAASKSTKPFQSAKPNQVLSLRVNPQALELRKRVAADEEFVAATLRGLKDLEAGRLTSQEDLDRLCEESS